MFKKLWRWIVSIKGSAIAFAVSIVLCFLLIGIIGGLLFFPVAPVLMLAFPHIDQWHGDWVWPAVIMVNLLWSFGFLIAGVLDSRLIKWELGRLTRGAIYLFVLWLWALIVWFVVLSSVASQGHI